MGREVSKFSWKTAQAYIVKNFMRSDWSILLIQLKLWGPRIKPGKYGKGSLFANNGFSLLLLAK